MLGTPPHRHFDRGPFSGQGELGFQARQGAFARTLKVKRAEGRILWTDTECHETGCVEALYRIPGSRT